MKELFVYLKNYKKECVLSPLFKMFEASFELLVPLVMAKMIDVGIQNGDTAYILKMGGLLVLLGVIGLVCSITAQYFAAKAAGGFGTELRNHLFSHINSFSYKEIDGAGTATLVNRMTNDIGQMQNCVNLVLRLFLRSPFVVFGAMVMAFTIDVKEAMVFVVAIPLLSIVVFGIMLITMPLYKKVQGRLDEVLLLTRESLSGARVIRAFHREQDEIENFHEMNRHLVDAQKFVGKLSALMNPLTNVIINGAALVLIWSGAWQVEGGILTQGALVALINYMSQILVELVKLANLILVITKAMACGKRVTELFHVENSLPDTTQTDPSLRLSKGEVTFQNVEFSYQDSREPVLSGITFDAQPGRLFGIIGGTGSGKSTLVNLIARFYEAGKGQILLDGTEIGRYPVKELRSRIGVVPQKAVLFKGTIRDNLRWGKKDATDEEINDALRISQAKEFVDEKGLDFMLSAGGKNLSGGQRQRLTIARALVKRPAILILDDSASALDYATDKKLREAVEKELSCTTFVVSQRVSSIRHASQILVLDDGKIAGIGDHNHLYENCSLYRELCFSQMSKEEAMQA